jgi:hypothetical protein
VVEANSQVRTLIADVRKVFDAIVVSIELVDLKRSPKWSIRKNFNGVFSDTRKGNKLIFLYIVRISGNCSNTVTWCSSGYEEATQINAMTVITIQYRVLFSI